jgi:hypothetical protein
MVMKWLLKAWSYISNPIFVPALVSLWYFVEVSMSDPNMMRTKMYLILILTAAIPLLLFLILKVLKAVSSIHLEAARERITPLLLYCILLIILVRGVFKDGSHQPLYYFFIGVLMASFVALALALVRYKISLHMLAMGGALGFVLMLSINLGITFLNTIVFLIIASGITASSRLLVKAHEGHELWFGIALGLASQVIAASYYIL